MVFFKPSIAVNGNSIFKFSLIFVFETTKFSVIFSNLSLLTGKGNKSPNFAIILMINFGIFKMLIYKKMPWQTAWQVNVAFG